MSEVNLPPVCAANIDGFFFKPDVTKEELEASLKDSRERGDRFARTARSNQDLADFYYARGLAVRRKLLELGGE